MIQLPSASAISFRGSPRPALPGGTQGAAFAELFAPDAGILAAGKALVERQGVAEPGKDLPAGKYAPDEPGAELAPFAWFAIQLAPPTEARPIALALPAAAPVRQIRVPEAGLPVVRLPGLEGSVLPRSAPQADMRAHGEEARVAFMPIAAAPAAEPAARTVAAANDIGAPAEPAIELAHGEVRFAPVVRARPDAVASHDAIARSQTTPVPAPVVLPRADSAAPQLAVAIAAADVPAQRRTLRETIDTIAPAAPTSVEAHRTPQVAPAADAPQTGLDTRRQEWIANLVERIEMLRETTGRETTGSRATVIRLSPDALGSLDISIAQEGDRVHVRFSAETPAARALLAEAQPRLAELAEARGIRLGQTSVDAGAAGEGGRHQHAPAGAQPAAPPPVRAEAASETDQRIA